LSNRLPDDDWHAMPILLDACLTSHAYESLGVQSRRTSQMVPPPHDLPQTGHG